MRKSADSVLHFSKDPTEFLRILMPAYFPTTRSGAHVRERTRYDPFQKVCLEKRSVYHKDNGPACSQELRKKILVLSKRPLFTCVKGRQVREPKMGLEGVNKECTKASLEKKIIFKSSKPREY